MLSLSDTNPRFLQSWLRLQQMIKTGLLSAIHQQHTVYVDGTYGTAAGIRDNPARPFQTIQQGVNAALAGDVVLIAPGTYAENVTMPAISGLTLIGAGEFATAVVGVAAVASPVFGFVQATVVNNWTFQDMLIAAVTATPAVQINPSLLTTAFAFFPLALRNLAIAGSTPIELTLLNNVVIENCDIGGFVNLSQCSQVTFEDTQAGNVNFVYSATGVQPSFGRRELRLTDSRFNQISATGIAQVEMFGSQATTLSGVLDDDATRYGKLKATHCTIDTVDVSAALTNFNDVDVIVVEQCKVGSSYRVQRTGGTGVVNGTAVNCTLSPLSGTINADDANLNLSGSTYKDAQLAFSGAGTMERDTITWTGTVPAVSGPIVPGWADLVPIRFGSNYTLLTSVVGGAGNLGVIAQTGVAPGSTTWAAQGFNNLNVPTAVSCKCVLVRDKAP